MLVRKILETTLAAGSTSVSFTDSDIPNSLIRIYSNDPNLVPVTESISGTTVTVTYEAQTSSKAIALEIVKQGLEIVDNVTSTDTDKALSANQGKILKDAIDSIVIPTVPENITDLNDVNVTDIEDGQILAWDDVSEKFVNVDQSSGSSISYSTTEQDTGMKWVDDKSIYQITLHIQNATLTSGKNIIYTNTQLSGLNIDKVISSVVGYLTFNNGNNTVSIPFALGYSSYISADYDSSEGIHIFRGGSALATNDIYLTILYTKTS